MIWPSQSDILNYALNELKNGKAKITKEVISNGPMCERDEFKIIMEHFILRVRIRDREEVTLATTSMMLICNKTDEEKTYCPLQNVHPEHVKDIANADALLLDKLKLLNSYFSNCHSFENTNSYLLTKIREETGYYK